METLQRTANRGSVSTGAYEIDNSCVFEDANSEGLHKSLSSQSQDCFTISFWLKRTGLGAQRLVGAGADGNNEVIIHFTSSDQLEFYAWESAYRMRYKTNRVFRDTSAFYHFAFLVDTRLSTASERTQIYVNGVLETSFATEVQPALNGQFQFTTNVYVGKAGAAADADMSGYLSEFVYLDDTKAAHTDLGEFDSDTGIWIPKNVSGLTFGTNGAYLDFKDSSNMGNDANGGTDFTLTNISAADQATDTPTNNFCIWSPLWAFYRNSTITEGGTEVAGAAGGWSHAGASMGVMNGRWYWEWKITSSEIGFISFSTLEGNLNLNQLGHDNSIIMGYGAGHLYTWLDGSQGSNESTGWGTWGVNDIISIFLDVENSDRRFTLYKNGSAISGTTSFPVSMPNQMQVANGGGNIFPYNVQYENDGGEWNFGGYTTISNTRSYSDANGYGSFVYNPVLGGVNYYAICTKNLAEFG